MVRGRIRSMVRRTSPLKKDKKGGNAVWINCFLEKLKDRKKRTLF